MHVAQPPATTCLDGSWGDVDTYDVVATLAEPEHEPARTTAHIEDPPLHSLHRIALDGTP